jgi:hypothetical protein
LVGPNKTNVYNTLGIINGHHETVLIVSDIKDRTVVAHNARIAVHIANVHRRVPGGPLGVTILRLEGLLDIGVLFPKAAKHFEGDNAHVDII